MTATCGVTEPHGEHDLPRENDTRRCDGVDVERLTPEQLDAACAEYARRTGTDHEIDVVYLPTCSACGQPVDNPDVLIDGQWRSGPWRHL